MKKRVLALVLVLAVMLSCCPVFAAAEGDEEPQSSLIDSGYLDPIDFNDHSTTYVKWELYSDGTLQIFKNNPDESVQGTVAMGDFYSKLNETTTPKQFPSPLVAHKDDITKIDIKDGIRNIGNYVFYQLTELTEVVIGSDVETIGSYAFSGCSKLREAVLGDEVTEIGTYAFQNCKKLERVSFGKATQIAKSYAFTGCVALAELCSSATDGIKFEKDVFVKCPIQEIKLSDKLNLEPWILGNTYANAAAHPFNVSGEHKVFVKGKELTEMVIPGTTSTLNTRSLFGWNTLEKLYLTQSVTKVESFVFDSLNNELETYYAGTQASWKSIRGQRTASNFQWTMNPTRVEKIDGYSVVFVNDSVHGSVTADNYLVPKGDGGEIRLTATPAPGYVLDEIRVNNGEKDEPITGMTFEIPAEDAPDTFTVTAVFTEGEHEILACGDWNSEFEENDEREPDWVLDDTGTLYICGSEATKTWSTSEPAPWMEKYAAEIKRVEIQEGITKLGAYAFSGCSALESVKFPASLTSIGSYAFSKCSQLYEAEFMGDAITLSANVFKDSPGTFAILYHAGTKGWTSPVWGSYNYHSACKDSVDEYSNLIKVTGDGEDVYRNSQGIAFVLHENGGERFATVGKSSETDDESNLAGYYGAGNGSVCIPEYVSPDKGATNYKVTAISKNAFTDCKQIESIKISGAVRSVAIAAFAGCSNLTGFEVDGGASFMTDKGVLYTHEGGQLCAYPAGKTDADYSVLDTCNEIYADAFSGAKNLTEIRVPNSVTSIGADVFKGCENLTTLYLPFIGNDGSLDDTNNTKNTLHKFSYVFGTVPASLKYVQIQKANLAYKAFEGLSQLQHLCFVEFPDTLTVIPDNCFSKCTGLSVLEFAHDPAIEVEKDDNPLVEIPDSVVTIGPSAFNDCKSLREIYLGKNVRLIYPTTLDKKNNVIDETPSSSKMPAFAGTERLTAFIVSPDNAAYMADYRGALYTKDQTKLVRYPAGNTNTNYAVSNKTATLAEYAFQSCNMISALYIPDNVINLKTNCIVGGDSLKVYHTGKNASIIAYVNNNKIQSASTAELAEASGIRISQHSDYTYDLNTGNHGIYVEQYWADETLSYDGLVIELTPEEYTLTGIDPNKTGLQTVTVSVVGKELKQEIAILTYHGDTEFVEMFTGTKPAAAVHLYTAIYDKNGRFINMAEAMQLGTTDCFAAVFPKAVGTVDHSKLMMLNSGFAPVAAAIEKLN